ncbi:hypothetical protein Mgra_00002160 [Meloidogyne graminicola]|uniref:Uncharacterized protein n=1 Tax=Meloidogyne graminicola TaxID=189291 RepID=A0A8S9ZYZ0_9BILA|nr:hypothetical protein Mgra_00002160 [Meloidogyne graminicola]
MSPEIRFTPPRRAKRRIAGFVIPWMLSRKTLRWRFAPPFPSPFPPLPRPDIICCFYNFNKKQQNCCTESLGEYKE